MIKKISVVLLLNILILLVFSFMALAEDPPSLLNHQFYGEVAWEKGATVPSAVLAKVGSSEYISTIKNPSCIGAVCKGKYGYDADNILRVQGKTNDKILFFISGTQVKEFIYQEGAVTKLDFDLVVTKPATADKPTEPAAADEPDTTASYTATDEPDTAAGDVATDEAAATDGSTGYSQESAAESEGFDYVPPAEESSEESFEETPEEEESFLSSNLYLIIGIIFILIAIVAMVVILIRKNRGGSVQTESQQNYPQNYQ